MSDFLKEYRCKQCNKLFFKGNLNHCVIEVKCKNCKTYNEIEGRNCEFFLMLDHVNFYGEYNISSFSSKDGILKGGGDKCSKCVEKNNCESYKVMTKDNVCPFCYKKNE